MAKWVLDRLFEAKKQPIPRFAYQSTVNWMTALAIHSRSEIYSTTELKHFYRSVKRRKVNEESDTWVYENVLMALHNVAALSEMNNHCKNHNAIVRSAIVAWYYTIYYASSAMVAASSGSKQETHASTARVWHTDIVKNDLAVGPFGLSLSTLVEKDVQKTIESLKDGNTSRLVNVPQTEQEAWGAICEYLSGTAIYEKEKVEARVKGSKDFKALDVENFRTKAARELRDSQLSKGIVNFLVQSFRYRGKANYRDSIYLSYGEDRTESIKMFVSDLEVVASAFLKMTCHYTSKRVEKGMWDRFAEDLGQNLIIDVKPEIYTV